MTDKVNLNYIKQKLQSYQLSTVTSGLNGDDRYEELKYRLESYERQILQLNDHHGGSHGNSAGVSGTSGVYESGGGTERSFEVPSLNALSISEIRAKLTSLGESTNTPGLNGEERRNALVKRLIDAAYSKADDSVIEVLLKSPSNGEAKPTTGVIDEERIANSARTIISTHLPPLYQWDSNTLKKELKRIANQRDIAIASKLSGNSQDVELKISELRLAKIDHEMGALRAASLRGDKRVDLKRFNSDLVGKLLQDSRHHHHVGSSGTDNSSVLIEDFMLDLEEQRKAVKEEIKAHRMRIRSEVDRHSEFGVDREQEINRLLSALKSNKLSGMNVQRPSKIVEEPIQLIERPTAIVSRTKQKLIDIHRYSKAGTEGGVDDYDDDNNSKNDHEEDDVVVDEHGKERFNGSSRSLKQHPLPLDRDRRDLRIGKQQDTIVNAAPDLKSNFLGESIDLDIRNGMKSNGGNATANSNGVCDASESSSSKSILLNGDTSSSDFQNYYATSVAIRQPPPMKVPPVSTMNGIGNGVSHTGIINLDGQRSGVDDVYNNDNDYYGLDSDDDSELEHDNEDRIGKVSTNIIIRDNVTHTDHNAVVGTQIVSMGEEYENIQNGDHDDGGASVVNSNRVDNRDHHVHVDHEKYNNHDDEDGDDEAEVDHEKKQIKLLLHQAKQLERTSDIEGADNLYQQALDLDPLHVSSLVNYASFLHQKKGEIARAEAFYNRCLQVYLPGVIVRTDSHLDHNSLSAMEEVNSHPAVDMDGSSNSSIQRHGDDVAQPQQLHNTPQGRKKNEQSTVLPLAVNSINSSTILLFNRGDSHGSVHSETSSDSKRRFKIKHIVNFLLSYANFMNKSKGDIESSILLYQKGLELSPTDAHLLASYAHFLTSIGQPMYNTKATEYFQQALKLSPGNPQYTLWYAKLLKKIGQVSKAELMYRVSIEQSKLSPEIEPIAICNYATFLFKIKKDLPKSKELFEMGLFKYPYHKGLKKNYRCLLK